MSNKNYQDEEPGGKAEDPQLRGKIESGASFKPLSHPVIGQADGEKFGGFGKVKVDVELPGDPPKLPQVKGKE